MQATADRAGLVRLIRVAAPSDLTRSTLLPWLNEFLEAHPGVQLALSARDRTLDVARTAEQLPALLHAFRKQTCLTQADSAVRLGISQQALSNLECHADKVSADQPKLVSPWVVAPTPAP